MSQFSTPNLGVAAYLMAKGEQIIDLENRDTNYNGTSSERVFFVFTLSQNDGNTIASEFYDKKGSIEPNLYYENIKLLRSKVYDFKKQG